MKARIDQVAVAREPGEKMNHEMNLNTAEGNA